MQHKNSLKVGFYVYNYTNTDITRDTVWLSEPWYVLWLDPAVIIYIDFQDTAEEGGKERMFYILSAEENWQNTPCFSDQGCLKHPKFNQTFAAGGISLLFHYAKELPLSHL